METKTRQPNWLFAVLVGLVLAGPVTAQDEQASVETSTSTTQSDPANATAGEAFLFSGDSPTSIEQLKLMETRFDELAKKLFPATVNIQMGASQGSGVVVTADGYILTAAHVIGKPGDVATIVFPDEKRYLADSLGVNSGRIDSGMLKIRNPKGESFPYIELGISEDLKKGQWVMAVGHPGGFDTARGLVARVGRIVSAADNVIRTDCTLVGGDSGGPLIDMNGELIGIHSRIGGSLEDNLHVPVDQYSLNWDKLAAGLILNGRPSLGFRVDGDTNRVDGVTSDGAADEAGIKAGDTIVSIESIMVSSKQEIADALQELNLYPNQKIVIAVQRGDEKLMLDVVVGQR